MYRINSRQNDPRGSNYKDYRKKKQAKQDQQLQENQISNIFKDCLFWLDGRLEPTATFLRQIIGMHGGLVVFQYNKNITHIIAQNLSSASYQKYFHRYTILLPSWIIESINKSELASYDKFLYIHNQDFQVNNDIDYLKFLQPREIERDIDLLDYPEIPSDVVIHSIQYQPSLSINLGQISPQVPSITSQSPVQQVSLSPPKLLFKDQSFLPKFDLFNTSNLVQRQKLESVQYLIQNNPYGPNPSKTSLQLYIYISIDQFYINSLIFDNLQLYAGIPIIVVENNRVFALNSLAEKFNIYESMEETQVKQLQIPNIQIFQYDFGRYQLISNIFLEVIRQYSSEIMLLSSYEAIVNVSGLVIQDNIYQYMQKIQEYLFLSLGINVTIGSGQNPFISFIANKIGSSNHLLFINFNNFQEVIQHYSIEFLKILTKEELKLLQLQDLSLISDLIIFSLQQIQTIIGEIQGKKLYQAIRGYDLIFNFKSLKNNEIIKILSCYSQKVFHVFENSQKFTQVFLSCSDSLSMKIDNHNLLINQITIQILFKQPISFKSMILTQKTTNQTYQENTNFLLNEILQKLTFKQTLIIKFSGHFTERKFLNPQKHVQKTDNQFSRLDIQEPIQRPTNRYINQVFYIDDMQSLIGELQNLSEEIRSQTIEFIVNQLTFSNNLEQIQYLNSKFPSKYGDNILRMKIKYIKQ